MSTMVQGCMLWCGRIVWRLSIVLCIVVVVGGVDLWCSTLERRRYEYRYYTGQ